MNSEQDNKEQVIELKVIISFFWKEKITILLVAAVLLIAAYFLINKRNENSFRLESMIEFNFDGIDQGKYPDGRSFVPDDTLRNISFISRALNELQIEFVSTADIKDSIVISSIIPSDVTAVTESKLLDGILYHYSPNKYYVVFYYSSIPQLKGSQAIATNILSEIIRQYRDWFDLEYSEETFLLDDLGHIDAEQYDYMEIIHLYRDKIQMVQEYLEQKKMESPKFRSSVENYSFGDLLKSLNMIESVDMAKLEAFIESNQIIKDKEEYKNTLQHQLKEKQREVKRLNKDRQALKVIMDDYLGAGGGQVTEGQAAVVQDQLPVAGAGQSQYAEDVLNEYREISSDIGYLEKDIDYIKERLKNLQDAKMDKGLKKEADKKLVQFLAVVQEWAGTAGPVIEEYSESQTGGAVSVLSPPQVMKNSIMKPLLLAIAFAGAGGIFAGGVKVFLFKLLRKRRGTA